MPNLHRLLSTGAVGLMNTRSPGFSGDPHNLLATMGAGRHVVSDTASLTKRTPLGDVLARHEIPTWFDFSRDYTSLFTLLLGTPTHSPYKKRPGIKAYDFRGMIVMAVGEEIIWKAVDWEIGRILLRADMRKTTFLIFSPVTRELAPILLAGRGVRNGVLTSSSTRWPGVVTNLDIAPTILSLFDIPLSEGRQFGMIGNSIRITDPAGGADAKPLEYVRRVQRWTDGMQRVLPALYTLFGVIEGVLTLIALLVYTLARRRGRSVRGFVRFLPTIVLLLPFCCIPVGFAEYLWTGMGDLRVLYFSATLAILLALACLKVTESLSWCVRLAGVVLLVDLGLHFSRYSPFAFSLITGSRFYGMGNEHMALLVACMVLSLGLSRERLDTRREVVSQDILQMLLIAGIALLLGNSSFGANFGGAITAAAALGTAWAAVTCERWTWKQTLAVTLFAIVIAMTSSLDVTRPLAEQSHIGRAIGLSMVLGHDSLAAIAQRKILMNWRLMVENPISFLLLPVVALVCKCVYRPFPFLQQLYASRARLHRALWGAPVGMIVGLLTNDSGIVVLAMMMTVYVAVILGLLIEESCPASVA